MMLLHGVVSGSGSEWVILLHGLFGSATNLGGVGRVLEPHFRVLRLDLRNHGRSFHLDGMGLEQLANDVLRKMDAEGVERAHFVGHSLGGKVAMQLALKHPQRVRRLVVADIAPVAYPRGHDVILAALQGIDLRGLRNREHADELLLRQGVEEKGVRQFLLTNLTRDGHGQWRWRMNLAGIAADYDAMRLAPEGERFEGAVLFIKGEHSRYITEENRCAIVQRFPGSRLEIIEGAGHWVHGDKPRLFNQLVERFLLGNL